MLLPVTPWHSQEGAVIASSYRRQSWQQSEVTCPTGTAMTTLELSLSRSGLLAPKSRCSHYSTQVTQEDANRRKASNMLGLFSLMRTPAKSCHNRLRHRLRLTLRRNLQRQYTPASSASSGTHHIALRCFPPLDPSMEKVGKNLIHAAYLTAK